MGVVTSVYKTLDDHTITVSGPDLDLSLPWTASILYLRDAASFGFQSGPIGHWSHLMVHYPDFAFSESYGYQSGTLQLGSAPASGEASSTSRGSSSTNRIWLGYWEGTYHSLAAVANSVPEGIRPDLLGWFETFDLSDSPEGVTLDPRTSEGVQVRSPEVVKELPTVGLLSIMDVAQASSLIPSWMGTPVEGGELFLSKVADFPEFFVLVGESALTVIQPIEDDVLETPERMYALEHLVVGWT